MPSASGCRSCTSCAAASAAIGTSRTAFLLYQSPLTDEARERLTAMTDTTDGFEIAERDLQLRGPGDFFGTRQAGMPTFRMIDLVRDREVLDTAQAAAAEWFDASKPNPASIDTLLANWEQRFKLIDIG